MFLLEEMTADCYLQTSLGGKRPFCTIVLTMHVYSIISLVVVKANILLHSRTVFVGNEPCAKRLWSV